MAELKNDIDDDGNCLYCGNHCFDGEMCDEQQAGGFNELKNDFNERFHKLYIDALDHIKSKLREVGGDTPKGDLILVDIEQEDDEGCIPDEIYEMPTQIRARKYDFIPYNIWKITPSVAGMRFHGWDNEEGDHVFAVDELDFGTVICIAGIL